MNERIKELRKALGLTQQEFADRLGISRNNIATYETRKTGPGNSVVKLICNTFNVSEEWLRTGDGEMFVPKPESAIDKLVAEFKLGELEKQIILEFIGLEDKDRQGVIKYVRRLSQNKTLQAAQEQPAPAMTVEQEADQFAARLTELERQNQELVAKVTAMEEEDALEETAESSASPLALDGAFNRPSKKQ